MGVTGLWPVLSPVKQHQTLSSLAGQTLAVDLSIWVCENQGVRQMQNRVQKPHLRNLFFRVSALLQLGVRLVFVVEGEAPVLKHAEMGRRLQARHKGASNTATKRKFNRSHFKTLLKECCELLDAVGVPYIQSHGEAEAMCAALNSAGLVDACLSDDGDCFLYGAEVVYKNLTLDTKDPHVESYSMADVTSRVGLTRDRLVALALLTGCDFYPAGVPGIGEARAVKLLSSLASVDILDRFRQWKGMAASECADSVEASVWRKASSLSGFPPQDVIDEFLKPKERMPSKPLLWQRPNILKMMDLAIRYLEWPGEYSIEKILPLTTLWDQLDILSKPSISVSSHLKPRSILKRRVKQGVHCFEVQWENEIEGVVDESGRPKQLVTLEQEDRFHTCFPDLVKSFIQHTEDAKASKSKKTRKAKVKDTEALADQMSGLSIGDQEHGRARDTKETFGSTCSEQDPLSCSGPSDQSSHGLTTLAERSCSLEGKLCEKGRMPQTGPGALGKLQSSFMDRGGKPGERTAETTACKKVSCLPISQGLQVSSGGSASVVDVKPELCETSLNDSFTYVPLGQRLKVLANENSMKGQLSDSHTYVPLGQRLTKLAADRVHPSQKEITIDLTELDDSLSNAPRRLKTDVNNAEKYSSMPLSLSSRNGPVSSLCSDSSSSVFHNPIPSPKSSPLTPISKSTKSCSVDDQNWSPAFMGDISNNTVFLPSDPVTSDYVVSVPSDIQGASKCDSDVFHLPEGCVLASKPLGGARQNETVREKKALNSNTGRKATKTHHKIKKVALCDLLENWSDSDSTGSNDAEDGSDSLQSSSGFALEPKTEELVFSNSEIQASAISSKVTQNSDDRTSSNAVIASVTNTPDTEILLAASSVGNSANEQCSMVTETSYSSFVSEGHFTIHHSLFTSMEDCDDSREASAIQSGVSPLCSWTPAFRANTVAHTGDRLDSGQARTHSDCNVALSVAKAANCESKFSGVVSKASSVHNPLSHQQLDPLPHPHNALVWGQGKIGASCGPGVHGTLVGLPDHGSAHLQKSLEESSKLETESDFECVGQCPALANSSSVTKVTNSTPPSLTDKSVSEVSQCLQESVHDVSPLPLSQRLKLRKKTK